MNERQVTINKARELVVEAASLLVDRGLEDWADALAHHFLTVAGEDKDFRPVYIKGSIPRKLRDAVFERDGYRCRKCSSTWQLQADHIFPESKGGETTMVNLETLCKKCNLKKGSKIE